MHFFVINNYFPDSMLSVTASSSFPCNATSSHSKILKHTVVIFQCFNSKCLFLYLNDLKTGFYFAVACLSQTAGSCFSTCKVPMISVPCWDFFSMCFYGESQLSWWVVTTKERWMTDWKKQGLPTLGDHGGWRWWLCQSPCCSRSVFNCNIFC